MSIAEPRTTGGRRRRRLAVTGEQPAAEHSDGPGGLARLRDRLGDLPASSPWLPRQLWKRVVIGLGYGLMLTVVGFLLVRPIPWPASLTPIANHLLSGQRPVLAVFVTTALWFAAGQFAALIGWYRSHSENDFHGRYRLWAVLAAAFASASFFAGTGVHVPMAQAVLPYWKWPLWRPEVTAWVAPLAAVGLLLGWRMDRDIRRCLAGLWLMRFAGLTMLAVGGGYLFATELSSQPWYPLAMTLAPLAGPGLLVLGLWLQACYVAYVCADPPELSAVSWFRRLTSLLLWPFARKAALAEEDAKPTRRRKKADEVDGEATPKRRRKPAAKTRKPTKSRSRGKPEADAEEGDEESTDSEAWENEDESWDESAAENADSESEDWQAEEEATRPAPATAKPAPQPLSTRDAASDSEEGDEDEDGYRVDGAHENAEMFKGLSKRQRRELKKQMRDQQRNR